MQLEAKAVASSIFRNLGLIFLGANMQRPPTAYKLTIQKQTDRFADGLFNFSSIDKYL